MSEKQNKEEYERCKAKGLLERLDPKIRAKYEEKEEKPKEEFPKIEEAKKKKKK